MLECKLLSKVITEHCYFELNRYNVGYGDFYTQRKAYKFIKDYVAEFKQVPSYETVVGECEDFDYIPDVADSIGYLCKTLKSNRARREAFDLLQNKASDQFNKLKGADFINWLCEETQKIKEVTEATSYTGSNWAKNGEERKNRYEEAKRGESIIIPTPYEKLNKGFAGGMYGGDYLMLFAFTNKGKSWICCQFGVTAWTNNFDVLHYSPEENRAKVESRLDTVLGHFSNTHIKKADLYNEDEYFGYLSAFNENTQHDYLIKTMEDLPKGLSCDVIEADLLAHPNTKMVIVDGLNLMRGISNNNRDNITYNSRRIRQMANRYNVVFVVSHQVSKQGMKESEFTDESGLRIVSPPKLDSYSEGIATIQDPTAVLSYDYSDGIGKFLVAKSRDNNKDDEIELQVNYDTGYIEEVQECDFI